eukprot:Nk52_evm15s317 gene=Nk52_evmTU15s317
MLRVCVLAIALCVLISSLQAVAVPTTLSAPEDYYFVRGVAGTFKDGQVVRSYPSHTPEYCRHDCNVIQNCIGFSFDGYQCELYKELSNTKIVDESKNGFIAINRRRTHRGDVYLPMDGDCIQTNTSALIDRSVSESLVYTRSSQDCYALCQHITTGPSKPNTCLTSEYDPRDHHCVLKNSPIKFVTGTPKITTVYVSKQVDPKKYSRCNGHTEPMPNKA